MVPGRMLRAALGHLRAQPVAYLALFFALTGTGLAARPLVTGKQVRNSSLTGADVRNNSLTGSDIRNGSLVSRDFKSGELPAGPKGDPGAPGARGAQGDTGTVDTSAFYDKAESDKRFGRATSATGSAVFNTATYTTTGTVGISAPSAGRVLVVATPHFGMNTPISSTTGDCAIDFKLSDGISESEAVTIGIRPGTTSAQSDLSGALTHVFSVTSPGTVTVSLLARFNPGVTTGTCQTWAAFPVMSALWAPYGP
jgi:hypothetical protein